MQPETKMKKNVPTPVRSGNERLEKNENKLASVSLSKIDPSSPTRKIQDVRKKEDVKKDESPSVQLFKKVKILKNPCGAKCTFKCVNKITANQRQQILKYFYGLRSLTLRKLFIQKCVEGGSIESKYHFTINGNRMQVCKQFYLSTLSVTSSYVNAALVYPGMDAKQEDSEKIVEKKNEDEEKKDKVEEKQTEVEEKMDVDESQSVVEETQNEETSEPIQATNEEHLAPEDMEHSLEYIRKEEEENADIKAGIVRHIISIPRIVTCLETDEGKKYVETYVKATKMYEHYLKYCEDNKCQVGGFPLYNKLFLENHEIMVKARKDLPAIEPGDVFILNFDREPYGENE